MALQAVFRCPGLGFFAVTRQAACGGTYLWREVKKGRGQRKAGSAGPGRWQREDKDGPSMCVLLW